MKKLPITAIVVGLNEGKLLSICLSSIDFCDEILYIDLGSNDDSVAVATSHGANVIFHERVMFVEIIHSKFANQTKHDWILITDPDELVDKSLYEEIYFLFTNGMQESIGAITVPWLFYFKHKHLKGTPWGGINRRVLIVNNKRFLFAPMVHVGRKLQDGFISKDLDFLDRNVVHHFWMQGYFKLLEKHLRYLKVEGSARYYSGQRTSLKQILIEPFRQFKYGYIIKKGYKDGITGILLSLFWAWYQTFSLISLFRYQFKMNSFQ